MPGTLADVNVPVLRVRTRRIPTPEHLLGYADAKSPIAWLRRDDGLVARGEVWRIDTFGADRFQDAQRQWRELVAAAEVHDEVAVPGSGLVAFGAFAFDASSHTPSTLIVPEYIVGTVGEVSFLTEIQVAADSPAFDDELAGDAPVTAAIPAPHPIGTPATTALHPGHVTEAAHRQAVTEAVARIRTGALAKVVIARDLVGTLAADADRRSVVERLHADYPETWTYCVDGLVGASPEMLGRVIDGAVTARVLAGTMPRHPNADADMRVGEDLLHSPKNREEHKYAIDSALASMSGMRPVATAADDLDGGLTASPEPFLLKLPNVWHLASDIRGTLPEDATVFDLIAALHPTAAVGGTPRDAAMRLIAELEGVDRGRYAGPVGWCSAAGDGEWVIALRGAQITGDRVVAMAGGGIVASSDPAEEYAETMPKFRPIVTAFAE